MRLYLIRHGETEHNRRGIMQGHEEVPLNDTGIAQAALLAKHLEQYPLDEIRSSDLRRTAMTASIIAAATGAPITWEEGFRERHPGELTNIPHEDAMPFFTDPDYHPPGGESVPDFARRVKAVFDDLVDDVGDTSRHVAVVSHGMVCAAFLRIFLDYSLEELAQHRWPNTCLTIADYDGAWKLTSLADATHLEGFESDSSAHATGA